MQNGQLLFWCVSQTGVNHSGQMIGDGGASIGKEWGRIRKCCAKHLHKYQKVHDLYEFGG